MSTNDTTDPAADFDDALARAFAKVERARPDGVDRNIKKDGKDRRYVTLASVDQACREALTGEGFSFPQLVTTAATTDGGLWLSVTTQLRRRGVKIETTLGLPVLGQMRKGGEGFAPPTAQSVGSAMTYGRRYALSALMGVCPDEDDDGHAASRAPEPKADPLWEAYEAARDAYAQAQRITIAKAHAEIREAAAVTYNDQPTDAQLGAMTFAAKNLLAYERETAAQRKTNAQAPAPTPEPEPAAKPRGKGKASKPPTDVAAVEAQAHWLAAGTALVNYRTADYIKANGEEPDETLVAGFRRDAMGISERAIGAEPGQFPKATATVEQYNLAASQLREALVMRKNAAGGA